MFFFQKRNDYPLLVIKERLSLASPNFQFLNVVQRSEESIDFQDTFGNLNSANDTPLKNELCFKTDNQIRSHFTERIFLNLFLKKYKYF